MTDDTPDRDAAAPREESVGASEASPPPPDDDTSAQPPPEKPGGGGEAADKQAHRDAVQAERDASTGQQRKPPPPAKPTVVVRYGRMQYTGEFAHELDDRPRPGDKVVIRTDRGVELGEVVAAVDSDTSGRGERITHDQLNAFLKRNGPDYPFRRRGAVLRAANHQDIVDQTHLESSGREEAHFCREQIRELKLPMKLVTVEHLLGGERIVFYFSAESRVDFRELVRRLASQYRTRIEMRQVGARDEARLIADYERCGQRCCCRRFIKDLQPVSMRMAKTQKATLDPSKISGRCGRLMCCLRFEDETYTALRKKLPRRNSYVRTETLHGRVVDTQILTQLVMIELADRSRVAVAVEDITERDAEPLRAAEPSDKGKPRRSREDRPPRRLLREQAAEGDETASSDAGGDGSDDKGEQGGGEQGGGTSGESGGGKSGKSKSRRSRGRGKKRRGRGKSRRGRGSKNKGKGKSSGGSSGGKGSSTQGGGGSKG